jgi:hypothetical protein
MDGKIEFNKVLSYTLRANGCMFRKDGIYRFDSKIPENQFLNNIAHIYDYFTLFTKNNQLVEYIYLGNIPIQGDLYAHKAAKKYTNYQSEESEDDAFRSFVVKALKNNTPLIFKNSNDGYSFGHGEKLLKNILASHYFAYIEGYILHEFFRFDIRTIMPNMELPKL